MLPSSRDDQLFPFEQQSLSLTTQKKIDKRILRYIRLYRNNAKEDFERNRFLDRFDHFDYYDSRTAILLTEAIVGMSWESWNTPLAVVHAKSVLDGEIGTNMSASKQRRIHRAIRLTRWKVIVMVHTKEKGIHRAPRESQSRFFQNGRCRR